MMHRLANINYVTHKTFVTDQLLLLLTLHTFIQIGFVTSSLARAQTLPSSHMINTDSSLAEVL